MNKKMALSALGIVALSANMAFGLAAPGSGVVDSIHDMNLYTPPNADGQGRVCAFCHTPHHAMTEDNNYLPLWSHALPDTSSYEAYKTATVDAYINPATMMEGPSKLCMSCHDGAIAVDTHYSTTPGSVFLTSDGWNGAGLAQTETLSNDHPIGFVYENVAIGPDTGNQTDMSRAEPGKDKWIRNKNALYLGNTAITIEDRLFVGTPGAKGIMTCATCHDVHNKKNVDTDADANYLLLSPNAGSQLCLTCHIK